MMFEELRRDGKIKGYQLARDDKFYFFGTAHTAREDLPRLFPQYDFCFLKQVHGREVINAKPGEVPHADGHFTETPGLALVSQSADCMPILLSSNSAVCAIHAGWRGMALNIIAAAKDKMPAINFAAIGPHIMCESFEIGLDVAQQLHAAAPAPDSTMSVPASDPQKRLFDLRKLAAAQLARPFTDCSLDTKSNPLFHSYRRGKALSDRQYSFVVINRELR